MPSPTRIGIIGGTGLYDLEQLSNRRSLSVDTPFGEPSSPIVVGTLGGSELCFLARHGVGHRYLPSEVPYRANIYALKELGVQWCIGVSAVGSLTEEFRPGDLVIPHQVFDRTRERPSTFFGNGIAAHVAFADPFCSVLREALCTAAAQVGVEQQKEIHSEAVYVCMEGPAFSTRAESHWHRSIGASLIGMTVLPEAKLAREAEMSYATLALVTDYDCWRSETADVELPEILKTMSSNAKAAQAIIAAAVPLLHDREPAPEVRHALQHAILTDRRLWPKETSAALQPLLRRLLEEGPKPG